MVRAVKQIVTIQPGGRIELTSDQLPDGKQAEVIVLLEATVEQPKGEREAPGNGHRPIWEVARQIAGDLTEDELANLPTDLAAEHDHYLYGTPKRYT